MKTGTNVDDLLSSNMYSVLDNNTSLDVGPMSAADTLARDPQAVTDAIEGWSGHVAPRPKAAPVGKSKPKPTSNSSNNKGRQAHLAKDPNGNMTYNPSRAPVGRQSNCSSKPSQPSTPHVISVEVDCDGCDMTLGEDDDSQHRCGSHQLQYAQECMTTFAVGRDFVYHPRQYGLANAHMKQSFQLQTVVMW